MPPLAYAESIIWSKMDDVTTLCNDNHTCIGGAGFYLSNIFTQITYNVQVTGANTGTTIARNATVPVGSKVKYEFIPHVYSDVYWFATGGGLDSPYGDWVGAAAAPLGNICIEKNYLNHNGKDDNYLALSVAPPNKSLTNLPGDWQTARTASVKPARFQQRASWMRTSTMTQRLRSFGITAAAANATIPIAFIT